MSHCVLQLKFCVLLRAGHLQTALSFLLNAKDNALPEVEVEWARYKHTQVSGKGVITGVWFTG